MRIIHASSENGRYEAVVFVEEDDSPATDFFEGAMPGKVKIDFDGEVEMPGQFLPADCDVYMKR